MDSPHNSTPVQQTRRRSSFVRCYNCDQWFSCSQLLMQHKTAEHPVAEAVRRMGLKIVKNKESGRTTAIIPTAGDAADLSVQQQQEQEQQQQQQKEQQTQPHQPQKPPVPDLVETVELLDHLKLLSVGQRAKRRQRRMQRRTLDSPDTAAAAVAAATAAAAVEAEETAAGAGPVFSCPCGALLPDLPLVKQLHMSTAHESPQLQPRAIQQSEPHNLYHHQQQQQQQPPPHLHSQPHQQQSPLPQSMELLSPTVFGVLPPGAALALSSCSLMGHQYPLHATPYFLPSPIAFQTPQPPPLPPLPLPPTLPGYAAAFQQHQPHHQLL